MTNTKELLDLIIKQKFHNTKPYMDFVPTIYAHFSVERKSKPGIDSHNEMMQDIIKWESGVQFASLEETINNKYIVIIRDKPKIANNFSKIVNE